MTVDFAGPTVTSDGGLLLLKRTELQLNLLSRLALCFRDARDPTRVQHPVAEPLSQRVFGLALGYECRNDHDRLRHDPLLGAMAGKIDQRASLAGKAPPTAWNSARRKSPATRNYPATPQPSTVCWSMCSWKRTRSRPRRLPSIWIRPICRCMTLRSTGSFMAITTNIAMFRSTCLRVNTYSAPGCGRVIKTARPVV